MKHAFFVFYCIVFVLYSHKRVSISLFKGLTREQVKRVVVVVKSRANRMWMIIFFKKAHPIVIFCLFGWMCRCVCGWICGCMGGWMCGWMDVWVDGCVGGWMCGWMYVWLNGCVDVWLDRCVGKCVVGWM